MKGLPKPKQITLRQTLPYIFIIAGIIGCIASFALTYDKIQVLKDASYVPSCNYNPILSCGSVMKTEQASLLGVPNTIFGLMGFTALTMIGVVLATGSKLRKELWLAINAAALAGFGFFIYLFFQGVYRINAICPFCFAVWMVVPPVLWYTTLYNLREGNFGKKYAKHKFSLFLQKHHGDIMLTWYVFVFALLLEHFWYYWKTLLP
ncbi:MAG: vitamin K epoxide reductase family protein [Patescibacteria group bacterium]